MSKLEKPTQESDKEMVQNVIADIDTETEDRVPPTEPGLGERVRKLLRNMQHGGPEPRKELAKDRTRSLALLIGGTVGAVLLFIGVFSTPTAPPTQQTSRRQTPNLGGGVAPNPQSAPRTSVTPLLNADVGTDGLHSDQLSPADIEGTSRRSSAEDIPHSPGPRPDARVPQAPPPLRNFDRSVSSSNAGSDPLSAYRLNNSKGVPTYSYGAPAPAGVESSRPQTFVGALPTFVENRPDSSVSTKSSIVFVRSSESAQTTPGTRPTASTLFQEPSLLLPGTRLAARLENAATTALKMPVVASIEYNYESDGMIIVPAGTRVFGDIQQASSEGYLHIQFHTLRMPDGREEAIEATGVSLDHQPLKGQVSGKNSGKKLLSRTLSGVGTVAAYVVGGGGVGLTRTVTGESLLRDRLAGNVALAGEQEFTSAAYSENISVTVPANTRFYVVLQKPAVAITPPRPPEPARSSVEMPTVQELRELMELRREINRMYQDSTSSVSR